MKNRIHRLLRATAIATLIAYLPTSIDFSYAASGSIPMEMAVPSSFKLEQNLALGLPAELGRMDSFHPGSKGTLLHIQTAHGHYEAQEKIEKLLGWLSEKFGDFPILLEGAADQLDPSRLEFFPGQPEANLQNARWLAKKSLVTGSELFLLRNKKATGIGVESEDAYRKNHSQFARVLKAKKEAEHFSEAFKLQMEKKAAVFSPELRAFLKRLEQGALGIVPLDVWLPELQRTALKYLNLDLNDAAWQVRWSMMVRFFKIQNISQEFNSEKFESEKTAFLIQIQKHLPASGSAAPGIGLYERVELLLNSMGKSAQLPEPETENAFTEMLRFLPADFDFEPYREVGKWIALLVLQSQLDFSVLAEEISRLENLIAEKLARNEDEKNLLKIFTDYRLLEKLLALQLTPSDFDKVNTGSAPRIKPSMFAKQLSFSVPHLTELDFVFDEAVSFYRGAKLRDAAMIQRAAEYFKQHHPKFAVLVTGGFHSKPMREHFEKAGYAYGVVTPAITGLDEAGYQAYLKAMLTTAVSQPTASNQMIELALGSGPRLGEATQLKRAALTVRRVRAGKDLEGWRAARSSTPIIAAVAMARSETREAVLKRDGVFEIIESPDLRLRLRASEFLFGSTRWGQVTTGTLRFQIEQFQDERWVALSPTDENEQEIVVSTASGAQPAVIRLFSPVAWSKEHRSFSVLIEGDQRIPMRIFENQKNAIRQHVVSLSNIQEDAANSSVAVSGDQFEVSEILADAIEVVSGQANRSETDPDAKPNDYDFAFRQLSDYRDQFSVANDLISDVRRWEQSEDDVQKLMSRVVSQAIGRSNRSEFRGLQPDEMRQRLDAMQTWRSTEFTSGNATRTLTTAGDLFNLVQIKADGGWSFVLDNQNNRKLDLSWSSESGNLILNGKIISSDRNVNPLIDFDYASMDSHIMTIWLPEEVKEQVTEAIGIDPSFGGSLIETPLLSEAARRTHQHPVGWQIRFGAVRSEARGTGVFPWKAVLATASATLSASAFMANALSEVYYQTVIQPAQKMLEDEIERPEILEMLMPISGQFLALTVFVLLPRMLQKTIIYYSAWFAAGWFVYGKSDWGAPAFGLVGIGVGVAFHAAYVASQSNRSEARELSYQVTRSNDAAIKKLGVDQALFQDAVERHVLERVKDLETSGQRFVRSGVVSGPILNFFRVTQSFLKLGGVAYLTLSVEYNRGKYSFTLSRTVAQKKEDLIVGEVQPDAVKRSEAREWTNPNSQKIVVIGTGFVGATKAVLAATDYGHDVVGVEASPEKREKLARGEPTFTAKYFPELLKEAVDSGKLNFTSNSPEDLAAALLGREIVYLALPTPQSESGEADIRFLKDAVRQIANAVKPGERKILIGKSTAPPKMTVDALRAVVDEVLAERRERGEDIQNTDIQFAWEPEFLREGAEVEDDRELSARIVIGAETPEVAARVKAVYENFNPNLNPPRKQLKIITTDLVSAPLVKYAANGWRGTKISFINYISWLTEELGFDIDEIANAIGEDSRVVRSFLNCGLGFGGSCFPKDLAAFVKMAKDLDVSPGIVLDALAVNQVQVDRFVSQMINELDGVSGKKIVILGGAFKPETSDTREARSIIVARELLAKGANVIVVDPDQGAIRELERELQGYGARLKFYTSLEKQTEIFSGASAIALVTEWKEFKSISFDQIRRLFERGVELPKVFDGRNALNGNQLRDLGFKYFDLGRGEEDVEMVDKRKFINAVTLLFLALRISYMNTLAEMAEKLGANIHDVKQGFGYDPVVSNAAKGGEIEYLNPGLGWGGYHLPRAVDFMADLSGQAELFATLNQFDAARNAILEKFGISKDALENTRVPFVDTAKAINQRQIQVAVEKMKRELDRSSLAGVKIAVAGLAHKQGENIDSSPSIALIQALAAEGAEIHAWDPDEGVRTSVNHLLKKTSTAQQVHYFGDLHEAMRTTEMQVIAYVSPEFLNKPEKLVRDAAGQVTASFIFDARHIFVNPAVFSQFGVSYAAVGMPTLRSESRIGSESAKLRVSEISDSLSLMGWTRFSDFRIKGGVGGPFTVQLVSRKIKSVDEKVLAEQLQTRLNILRTMGKISVTSQGDALAVAANRSEARSLELITPAVFWAGVSAFAFGVSASPVIIGVTGVWALLNLALILRPYFLSFNNRVKEKTFFQKYGRTNFGYEPEGALSHFEGGAEDYKGFIYGMTPVLVGAIAAILFFPVIGFASLVLGTAVALGTVLIELMFENVVSTLLRIFVYQTIENIADIVRFYAHEPKIRSAANAVIRRFAERHILPEGGILAVLGNPTPEYPRQVVELIKKMNPQAVLIVGNGGLDKDGNQIKKPEYENIREKVLEILAQENLADHWKDKIFVSEKDKSMNTGQNVGVVAEILARERAAFEARGISLKRMVLTQMPAGMLLSRRIFEYQWASNAKAVKIEDVQPQFISYAAAQPEMSEGAPVSEETEDLLRFIVLGPQGDGKGQVWRLNEWHQGKKPLIRFHAEDHLPAETLEVVRQFLARSEARSGLDPLVLTISTPYAFGVPIFFAGVWDGKNLHIILDDQRPEHERYLFDRKKLERNAQAGKLPEGYQQIPAKFKGADVLLNLEVQTPADFFNDEEIQRELEAKVLEAMRAVLRSESRGNTPFPENLTPFALLQSMTDRALVAAQKAKKASKITAIMTASENVLAAMQKEFDGFEAEDRQAWAHYFERSSYESIFRSVVDRIYLHALEVYFAESGDDLTPSPDEIVLAVRKLLRRELEVFLKSPGQTNLNLLRHLQESMMSSGSLEQLIIRQLLQSGLLGAMAEMGFVGAGGSMPISIEILPLGDDDGWFGEGSRRSEARLLSVEDVDAVKAALREKIQIGETVLNNGLADLWSDDEKSLQIHDGEALHPEAKNVHPTNPYVLLTLDWAKVWPVVEKLTNGQVSWKVAEAVLNPYLQSALEKFGAGDAHWLLEHHQDGRDTKSVFILFKARSESRGQFAEDLGEASVRAELDRDGEVAGELNVDEEEAHLHRSDSRNLISEKADFWMKTGIGTLGLGGAIATVNFLINAVYILNTGDIHLPTAQWLGLGSMGIMTVSLLPFVRALNLRAAETKFEEKSRSETRDAGVSRSEAHVKKLSVKEIADNLHAMGWRRYSDFLISSQKEVYTVFLGTALMISHARDIMLQLQTRLNLQRAENSVSISLTNEGIEISLRSESRTGGAIVMRPQVHGIRQYTPDEAEKYLKQIVEGGEERTSEETVTKANSFLKDGRPMVSGGRRGAQKLNQVRDFLNSVQQRYPQVQFRSEAREASGILSGSRMDEAREMDPVEVFKDRLMLERKNNGGILFNKIVTTAVAAVLGGVAFGIIGSLAVPALLLGAFFGSIVGFFGFQLVYGDVMNTTYYDNLEDLLDADPSPARTEALEVKRLQIQTGVYESLVASPLKPFALQAVDYALAPVVSVPAEPEQPIVKVEDAKEILAFRGSYDVSKLQRLSGGLLYTELEVSEDSAKVFDQLIGLKPARSNPRYVYMEDTEGLPVLLARMSGAQEFPVFEFMPFVPHSQELVDAIQFGIIQKFESADSVVFKMAGHDARVTLMPKQEELPKVTIVLQARSESRTLSEDEWNQILLLPVFDDWTVGSLVELKKSGTVSGLPGEDESNVFGSFNVLGFLDVFFKNVQRLVESKKLTVAENESLLTAFTEGLQKQIEDIPLRASFLARPLKNFQLGVVPSTFVLSADKVLLDLKTIPGYPAGDSDEAKQAFFSIEKNQTLLNQKLIERWKQKPEVVFVDVKTDSVYGGEKKSFVALRGNPFNTAAEEELWAWSRRPLEIYGQKLQLGLWDLPDFDPQSEALRQHPFSFNQGQIRFAVNVAQVKEKWRQFGGEKFAENFEIVLEAALQKALPPMANFSVAVEWSAGDPTAWVSVKRSEARNFRADFWSYDDEVLAVKVPQGDLEQLNLVFKGRIPENYAVDGIVSFEFDGTRPYQVQFVKAPQGSGKPDIYVGNLNLGFQTTHVTEGIFQFKDISLSEPLTVEGSAIKPQTLESFFREQPIGALALDRIVLVRQSPTDAKQTVKITVQVPQSLTVSPAVFLDGWFEQKNAGLSFEKSVERKLIKKITFVGVGVAASPAARGVDLPSPDYLNLFSQSYVEQVAKGMSGEEGGLAAVVSYVPEPTGKEKGLFYAVDFGGTNFRVMAVRLKGDGRYEIVGTPLKVKLPSDLMKGPSRNLFAFFAEKFKTHFSDIQKQELIQAGEEAIRIGFTYSYPAKLNGRVDSATAIALSKNLQSPDLVGQDVALLFQEALDLQFEEQSAKPQVVAVANDTVGTAVVGKLQNPRSIAGLILGTGRNLARKIKSSLVRNLEGFSGEWVYLNDESGLNTHVPESESVISKTDKKLFELYKHLGSDIYQKMTSGMYVPELIRLRLLEAAEQGLIFQSGIPYYLGSAWNEEDLVPEGLLAIFSDMTLASELQDYPATAKALAKLGVNLPTQEEVKLFYSTVVGFYRRSAYLSASEIMGTALFYSPELNEEVVVSIDGSLFEKVPAYKDWIETALADIAEVHFGDRAKAKNIQLELVKDGSGVGAAMIAAIVTARSEQRVAPANADEVVVPAALPYRQTLEAARLKLLNWLGGIVPQRWLSAIGFTDAARQVRAFTGNEAFAGEIPAEQQSVLDQNPGAQWMFNQNETVAAGLAQTLIHPSLMEAILKSGDGRAAFELLNQFASDAETDLSPLVAFVFDGDLKADLRKLMNAKKSGLTPTERLRIEPLLGLLQIQQSATDSVERAMNAYIQQHRSSRGIAVLLPDQSLLAQIHGALALALGKVVSGRDTIALARLARVLQQASLLEKEAQDLFLQRELPGITGKNGKWTHSAIQALLEQWIANHELVAVSA